MIENIKNLFCRFHNKEGVFECVGKQRIDTLDGRKINLIPFRLVKRVIISSNLNYETLLNRSIIKTVGINFMFNELVKCQVLDRRDTNIAELWCE